MHILPCILKEVITVKEKSTFKLIIKFIIVLVLIWNIPTKIESKTLSDPELIKAKKDTTSLENSISNVTPVASKNKKIHIYSTHQIEGYNGTDVIEASHLLRDKLISLGYSCDIEETDFESYKAKNGISYDNSYSASKIFLEKCINKNGSYDLIIDFHRDSIPKSSSTITVNKKSYAKLLFVVGQSSGKYENVLNISNRLHALANKQVSGISRGIMKKQSHYNQGISENMVLIEVGGKENSKKEVNNTVNVLATVIDEYLGG